MKTKKQVWQALALGAVVYALHTKDATTWWLAIPDYQGSDQQISGKIMKRLMRDHYIQSEPRRLHGPDSGTIHVTYWTQHGAEKKFYNRFKLNNKERILRRAAIKNYK